MPNESKRIYRFDDLEFWAEGGCIVLVDNRDGTTKKITPASFLDRAEAIGSQAAKWKGYPSEMQKFVNAANDMEKCAAEAAAQGDPTDPKVSDYNQRHKTYKKPMSRGVSIVSAPAPFLPKQRKKLIF